MAAAALSHDYAAGLASSVADQRQHAAYLGARLPATYAAVSATLAMVPDALLARVHSMLDIGAGPGTATWAAVERCPNLVSATLVDRSAALLGIATRLGRVAPTRDVLRVTTRVADVSAGGGPWPPSDLVMLSYALAELPPRSRASLVNMAWSAAAVLVVVEPGTPDGFERLHDARARAIAAGAHVVAPCPHEQACPMRDRPGDWCHFAVRVPRTRRHRLLKGGTLGHEDEKFACLVASKAPWPGVPARVLRHPRIEKGRVTLTLCAPDGIERAVVTRRDDAYRAARKTDWGDAWVAAGSGSDPEGEGD